MRDNALTDTATQGSILPNTGARKASIGESLQTRALHLQDPAIMTGNSITQSQGERSRTYRYPEDADVEPDKKGLEGFLENDI